VPASARRLSVIAVALGVLLLAGAALTVAHRAPALAVPAPVAVHTAVSNPVAAKVLRKVSYDHVNVSPVDSHMDRVSFFAGPRIAAEVAVGPGGVVQQAVDFTRLRVPYGNWLAYEPGMLVGLGALFVLMAGVAPLRRLRNLDVLAVLSLIAPVVLLEHRYVAASVVSAVPGLLYLMGRSARLAFADAEPVAAPSVPLLHCIAPGVGTRERVRVLRLLLGAVALIFVMVAFTSPDPVDVISAVMEGATNLVHGLLPYGHMPGDVVHGDTYPLLSYALYTPVALMAPVHSSWDSVDIALVLTAIVALVGAGALFRATAHRRRTRDPEAEESGLRAALVWLTFPPLLIIVSTATTDVVLAVMVLFAVLLYRRPGCSCALLAAAGWFKLAPAALAPIWLAPLRGRRLLAGLAGFAAVSAVMVAMLVAVGGTGGPAAMVHAMSYQFSRGSPQSLWTVLSLGWVQPIAQAAALALIAALTVHFMRRPALANERERLAAAAAAVLIAVQLVADYWAFLYLVWVLPLLVLSMLGQRKPATVTEPVTEPSTPVGSLVPVPAGK
jgi:hypothetical protein